MLDSIPKSTTDLTKISVENSVLEAINHIKSAAELLSSISPIIADILIFIGTKLGTPLLEQASKSYDYVPIVPDSHYLKETLPKLS